MEKEQWHLDKKVPIALIITIAIQTAAAIWWAASVNGDVEDQERRITMLESNGVKATSDDQRTMERLTRIETQIENQTEMMRDVRHSINRLITEWEPAYPPKPPADGNLNGNGTQR